ncbi:hypothetical protein CCACVL1_08580 [Corchorus capsularis]|uniref:Retrotransposon gag protein n=1 Tax=Corchorus capsularis TaxID=210143 RepID=A0A1R3IZQ6_COCAP|nr:hypothetical protein CCACVL1_08580 [Corchorus capsularis]
MDASCAKMLRKPWNIFSGVSPLPKLQLLYVLKSQDLLKYVDGSFPVPPVSIKNPTDKEGSSTISNPEFVTWTRIDQMLLGWINATLFEPILAQVVGLETSHEVWSNLHSLFSMKSTAHVMQLRSQLQNLQKKSYSISEYLKKIKSIAYTLVAIRQPVSDTDMVLYTLSSLSPKYESFTTTVSVGSDVPSFSELNSLMFHHESRLEQASQLSQTNIQNTAFVAQNNHTASFTQSNYYRGRGRGCHQFNYNNGRFSFHSPTSTPGLLGATPPFTTRSSIICQICRKHGHEVVKCNECFNQNYQSFDDIPLAFAALTINNAYQKGYSDIGATNHMVADPKELTNGNNYGGVDKIIVGSGNRENPLQRTM